MLHGPMMCRRKHKAQAHFLNTGGDLLGAYVKVNAERLEYIG